MRWLRRACPAATLASLLVLIAAALRAQQPPARPDTTRRAPQDTTARAPADTTGRTPSDTAQRSQADTTGRPTVPDSLPGWAYLPRGVVPTVPDQVPPGPLPPGSRYTFTRDSILWSSAQTLADLLTAVPGVYIARAGFLGQPEYVVYGGHGAASLEIFWDGVQLEPLGPDSVYLDAGRFPLTYLRRVDVEILPATLRVYLVSERHQQISARSVVRVMSGDFHTASYAGLFQRRWASGLGINLAGNFVGTNGASGQNRSDQQFDVWLKGEWLPSATSGAVYQVRRQQYDRDPVIDGRETVVVPTRVPAEHGARTDYILSLFTGTRPFGMGLRLEGGLISSTWTKDSVLGDRGLRHAYLALRYQDPRWVAEMRGRLGDDRITSGLTARAGWTPIPGIVLAGDAAIERHDRARESRRAHGTASVALGPFALVGELAHADAVQAPALPTDSAQATADRAVRLSVTTRPIGAMIGLEHRAAYQPLAFPQLAVLSDMLPTIEATYLTSHVRLQPVSALVVDGWYSNPRLPGRQPAADLQPPTHGRAQLTFDSKFWRTFRSGAFRFKAQLGMESWSTGTAGVDPTGTAVVLPGGTYYETSLWFQIEDFTFFWDLRDAYNARRSYVPGLDYPNNAQVFGVRWEFHN